MAKIALNTQTDGWWAAICTCGTSQHCVFPWVAPVDKVSTCSCSSHSHPLPSFQVLSRATFWCPTIEWKKDSLGYSRVCFCLAGPLLHTLPLNCPGQPQHFWVLFRLRADNAEQWHTGAVLGCAGMCCSVLGGTGAATLCWAQPGARFDDDGADVAGGVKLSAKSLVGNLCETAVACFACVRMATASRLLNAGPCKIKTCHSLIATAITILSDRLVYSVPDLPHF